MISKEQFEHQKKHLTRAEVKKLEASAEYNFLKGKKGSDEKEWNWQIGDKEKEQQVEDEKEFEINETELEQKLLKVDYQISKEGGFYFAQKQQEEKYFTPKFEEKMKNQRDYKLTPSTIDSKSDEEILFGTRDSQ